MMDLGKQAIPDRYPYNAALRQRLLSSCKPINGVTYHRGIRNGIPIEELNRWPQRKQRLVLSCRTAVLPV